MGLGRFKAAAAAAALPLCGGLQACASDTSWPSLSKITGVDNVMSPEERQKAMQDLQKNSDTRNGGEGAAAKPSQ